MFVSNYTELETIVPALPRRNLDAPLITPGAAKLTEGKRNNGGKMTSNDLVIASTAVAVRDYPPLPGQDRDRDALLIRAAARAGEARRTVSRVIHDLRYRPPKRRTAKMLAGTGSAAVAEAGFPAAGRRIISHHAADRGG
jgi:hypothetical protein